MFPIQGILAAEGGFGIMDAAIPSPGFCFFFQKGAGPGLFLRSRDNPCLISFRLSVTSDFINPFQDVVSSRFSPNGHILGSHFVVVIQESATAATLSAGESLHVGFDADAGLTGIWIHARLRACLKNPRTDIC